MPDPGAAAAAAFVAATAREGLVPPTGLRLLDHLARRDVDAPPLVDPFDLGLLHEMLVTGAQRSERGAWYTPRWLAEDLVGRVIGTADRPVARVSDPACGGGVFLLVAAEVLGAGRSPAATVGALRGCDVDPVAVAVTEAALWWWSARRGDPTVPTGFVVGDALTGPPLPPADVVVGNPPFLGQLRGATVADREQRDALRARFGDGVQPYTDPAWLFLLDAVESVEPGGAVALVQPSSLLGARDAGAVRRRIDERATLVHTWLDDGATFAASVEACAPVLRVGTPKDNDWSGALATARGIPPVRLHEGEKLGDVADVVAGFRDEYYGLVDAVSEAGPGPALVTSGAIDPLRHRVDAPVRFAKRRWTAPTVHVESLHGRAQRWARLQAGPKLLVATQTRVLEAAVDADGELIGSVPVIVVRPHRPEDIWRIAAAIHAPVSSAWMLRRSAGTALSNDACKPTARLLTDLPLPTHRAAWDEAAAVAEDVAGGARRWQELGEAADRAYGIDDPTLRAWWLDRLPVR